MVIISASAVIIMSLHPVNRQTIQEYQIQSNLKIGTDLSHTMHFPQRLSFTLPPTRFRHLYCKKKYFKRPDSASARY